MKTKFEVLWSKESLYQFRLILRYLRHRWSENEVKEFVSQLKHFEQIVVKFPEIYPGIKTIGLRKAVLSKHNSVIYSVDWKNSYIRVYTIFDNRQDPERMK